MATLRLLLEEMVGVQKQLLNNIIGTGTGHGGRIGVAGVYHRGGGGGGGYGGAMVEMEQVYMAQEELQA